MSKESLQEFITKVKSDDGFKEKVLSISDVNERLSTIRAEGFDVDEQDFIDGGTPLQAVNEESLDQMNCCIDVPYYYL